MFESEGGGAATLVDELGGIGGGGVWLELGTAGDGAFAVSPNGPNDIPGLSWLPVLPADMVQVTT